jgi:hypothetical protein
MIAAGQLASGARRLYTHKKTGSAHSRAMVIALGIIRRDIGTVYRTARSPRWPSPTAGRPRSPPQHDVLHYGSFCGRRVAQSG